MQYRTSSIPFLDVFKKLGIETFHKSGSEYGIIENGEKTGGWSCNTQDNFVTDFSKGSRPHGAPFFFVKDYLKLSNKETYERFNKNFPSYSPNEFEKKDIKNERMKLNDLGTTQINYLESRGIYYNEIKDCVRLYQGGIACLVYEGGVAKGMNARLPNGGSQRFVAMSGYPTKGCYEYSIDYSKKYLYVVEGLIDFLTLRQFESNVIGIKSNQEIDEIKRYAKHFELYIIFDNDEAGRITKEKLGQMDYCYYDREGKKGKDINDIYLGLEYDNLFVHLNKNKKYNTPIMTTIEKVKNRLKTLKEKGKLGFDGPFPFYDYTSGMVAGKIYTIGAFSNTGKSKLMYAHCSRFLQKGYKCLFISTEESEEDMFMNIMCTMTKTPNTRLGDIDIDIDKYKGLILNEEAKTIEKIDELVKTHKPDIVFIDYLQGLSAKGGTSYEKHTQIALGVQQDIAIANKVVVMCTSQLSNEMMRQTQYGFDNTIVTLKGSGDYYSASDVIMVLLREEERYMLKIEKNKLGPRGIEYDILIDFNINNFTFIKRNQNGKL